jgi:hypothetical protein
MIAEVALSLQAIIGPTTHQSSKGANELIILDVQRIRVWARGCARSVTLMP